MQKEVELVIKIPEDTYNATCKGNMLPPDVENVVQGIKNGAPLNDVLDEIRAEIPTLSHYQSNDGQDLVMVADVSECIDKYREEQE